jgi:hypothetical protein
MVIRISAYIFGSPRRNPKGRSFQLREDPPEIFGEQYSLVASIHCTSYVEDIRITYISEGIFMDQHAFLENDKNERLLFIE